MAQLVKAKREENIPVLSGRLVQEQNVLSPLGGGGVVNSQQGVPGGWV